MGRKKPAKKQLGADGGEMSRFYMVLGAVAVIGIGAVGYSVGSDALGGAAVSEPVEVEGLDDPQRLVEMAQGVSRGQEDAPVTIVEFGDYQCPGCGTFALQVKPRVELAYIETGQAKLVFYDFPLVGIHPNAFVAARAARCAGDQGSYWEYHDALFRNQPRWSRESSPVGLFVDYAEELQLDGDAFEACLESDRHADVVSANMRLAEELGVNGTPTIMISAGDGMPRRLANFDFGSIQSAVEELQETLGSDGGG